MSSGSDVSSIATTLARPGQGRHRSSVQITINDHYTSKVYTTGSAIDGHVTITPWRDTRFDHVQILLVGTARTRLDTLQVPQHSSHVFLKLAMPVPDSAYPVPRILEAGRAHVVPFNFVVPAHLTESACGHRAESDAIRDLHTRLPPTLGGWDRDDMGPDMAAVEYAVKARVLRDDENGRAPLRLAEACLPVRVLPAGVEDPPLSIGEHDRGYALTKTKSLRRNLFSGRIGRVTASAAQPAAVVLSPDGRAAGLSTATVDLRFDPTSSSDGAAAPAPKINAVSAKLTATTYFSATPMARLPNLGNARHDFGHDQRLSYQTSTSLFSTAVDKVTWRQQVVASARRDSGYGSEQHSDEHGSGGRRGSRTKNRTTSPIYHTATLAIPFRLPAAKKMLVPTFHSCLVSRVYTLSLTLSVGSSSTAVTLQLPLQVVADGWAGADELVGGPDGLPSFDSVVALREEMAADEHLRPRTLQVPAAALRENSVLPGYDDLASFRRQGVRAM